jgi:hypothetical protein
MHAQGGGVLHIGTSFTTGVALSARRQAVSRTFPHVYTQSCSYGEKWGGELKPGHRPKP